MAAELVSRHALALVLLAGCAPKPPPAPAVEPAVDAVTWLDTPYTAEQLREAFPSGTRLVAAQTGPDGSVVHEHWTFLGADAEGVTIASVLRTPTGELVEDQGEGRSAWEELRDHARFPAPQATRVRETFDAPLGRFDGWRYEVVRPDEDGTVSHLTFWFADAWPGPPQRMEVRVGDTIVAAMHIVARTPPDAP